MMEVLFYSTCDLATHPPKDASAIQYALSQPKSLTKHTKIHLFDFYH